jgi:HlyD family secretion protein
MKITRRRIVIGGVVAGLATLIVLALRPTPEPVDIAIAGRGRLRVTVDEEGRTRVRDRYVVVAPASGRVERITLEEGVKVRRGETLVRLFAAPLDPRARQEAAARLRAVEDAQRAARAAVEQARASRGQAARQSARAESLFARNLISAEQREQAALSDTTAARQLEAVEFQAQAAAHDVELARAALSGGGLQAMLSLTSPVAGVVLRIPERSERVVAPGEPLLEIGDPSRLEVVSDLLSEDAVKVRTGDRVIVDAWGGAHPLEGHVRRIEPSGFTKVSALGVEEQRVNVIADLDEAPPQLGDAYRVETSIVLWEGADVLKIPASALFPDGERWAAFRLRSGRAERVTLQVGHRNPYEAEITAGLSAGDTVISHPTDKLADGTRAAPRPR